eukprot:COSAG06_NODE_2700_length_6427_cov_6.031448_2_plen_70_part_00
MKSRREERTPRHVMPRGSHDGGGSAAAAAASSSQSKRAIVVRCRLRNSFTAFLSKNRRNTRHGAAAGLQ